MVALARVTAPPAPPLPNTASSPEVHVALVELFHHWLAVSHAPAPSVWAAVPAFASHVTVAAFDPRIVARELPAIKSNEKNVDLAFMRKMQKNEEF